MARRLRAVEWLESAAAQITTRFRLNPDGRRTRAEKLDSPTRRCEPGKFCDTRKLADSSLEECAYRGQESVRKKILRTRTATGLLVLPGLTKARNANDTKMAARDKNPDHNRSGRVLLALPNINEESES